MCKLFSLAAIGLTAAGLTLATPATSRADSFGLNLNLGRGGIAYYQGLPAPVYVTPYPSFYGSYLAPYVYPPRPVVVYPEYYRSPYYRGWYDYHHSHHGHHHHH